MASESEIPLQSIDLHPNQGALFEVDTPAERFEAQGDYQLLDTPEVREEYVRYTERLIAAVIANKSSDLIFLDKSARPVAWLTKSLWPHLGIDNEANHVPMPNMYFANIDREQWGPIMGRTGDKLGGIDVSKVRPEIIEDLRATYTRHPLDIDEPVGTHPTLFDESNVTIVDEVMASGDTLQMAERLFSRAFPEAKFSTAYWMPPVTKALRKGGRVNIDLPIWYKDHDPTGRLVADRSIKASEVSASKRQRRGMSFLSTLFTTPDQSGRQLKREMQMVANDVERGTIPVTPGGERSLVAVEAIMRDINQVSLEEFVALKRQSVSENTPLWKVMFDYKMAKSMEHHPAGKKITVSEKEAV